MAHLRQSRPDYGLVFQVKVLKPFKLFPLRSEAEPLIKSRKNSKLLTNVSRKVDIRLPEKEDPNSHGARPVYSNHLDNEVDSDQ